jgi:peptidoglycan/xylan/chitin deacetylase (PgdA/CDA1 family)
MSRTRKIASVLVLALGIAVLSGSSAAENGPRGEASAGRRVLLHATLSQAGRKLVFTLRTSRPVALRRLDRLPAPRDRRVRHLCLSLRGPAGRREKRLCLGGAHKPLHRVGMVSVNAAGHAVAARSILAAIHRSSPRRIVLALDLVPSRAGLTPRRYRWRVLAGVGPCPPATGLPCAESLPARGLRGFRLRPVRAVGCTGGSGLVRHGPRDHRVVALTFDDGPSSYTPDFLRVLRAKHAHATFFEIGQEISGRAATLRRILRDGNEIGNHTTHHQMLPGRGDMAETSDLIEGATHFSPCLFRPPGGAVNSAVIAAAGSLGMKTITWDVDPSDWSNPGSGVVTSRVLSAVRPGSIVVMHDGGGKRSGTLAALPGIIDALRRHGYRFRTVTQLLGRRLIYRPYG